MTAEGYNQLQLYLCGESNAILSRELTDSIRTKIADAAKEPLFKNWQGVMVGDGLLWFSAYKDAGDKPWTYVIFAIGRFAFQPKDFFPPKEGANKSLQATGAARSVLDGEGDSLLPGFVAASFPAPVPELGR
jgi:hypothetical protein